MKLSGAFWRAQMLAPGVTLSTPPLALPQGVWIPGTVGFGRLHHAVHACFSSSTWVTEQALLNMFEAGLLTHSCKKLLSGRQTLPASVVGVVLIVSSIPSVTCEDWWQMAPLGDQDLGENPRNISAGVSSRCCSIWASTRCLSLLCLSHNSCHCWCPPSNWCLVGQRHPPRRLEFFQPFLSSPAAGWLLHSPWPSFTAPLHCSLWPFLPLLSRI